MTPEQKCKVLELRNNGWSYSKIGKELDLTIDCVRKCCVRSNNTKSYCKFCGKSFIQPEKRKKKLFCTITCKNEWWKRNVHLLSEKSLYIRTCPICKTEFNIYKHKEQKFCSIECYGKSRRKERD